MSVEINLLPWRERQRERRRRDFGLALAGMALIGIAGGLGLTYHYASAAQSQQQRNAYIVEQIRQLEGDRRLLMEQVALRDQLLEQLQVLDELQQGRTQTVKVLRGLTESLLDGVHYVELRRQGDQLYLEGRAQNNRQIAEQLRALATTPVFIDPVLAEVEAQDGEQHRFSLGMTQHGAPREGEGHGTEAGGT